MSQWPTRRWIIGPIVAVAVAVWVAAAAFQTVRSFGSQHEVMDTKLSEAERVLYYRMSPGQGPSIQLSGTEEALVLITHLVLPPAAEYDPTRRIRYGIHLQISAGDKLVWERPIYTQTRQSKDKELFDNVWRYENSFLRDSDDQVTDDRLFIVYLPPGVPTDAVLKVTLLGEGASQGLIRFYNRVRKSSLEQQLALRSLSAKDRRVEVWSNTFEPWSMLPRREQQSRLRYGTERLSALGEHGIDYDTEVVYYTGFRLPLEVLELDQAIKVDRHRFAAINLVGPTQLTIEVARDDGDGGASPEIRPETSSSDDAAVEISSVSDGYVAPVSGTLLPVGSRVEISVPAGLHSMRLTTRSSQRFAVRAFGPKNAAFGAPVGIGEEEGRLRPDEIRIPVLMSDSSDISLPIQVAGVGEPDPLSRLLRIEVRWLEPNVPAGIVARSSTFLAQDPASDQSVESSAERPIVAAASPKSGDQSGTDAADAFAGSLQVTFLDRDGKPVGQTERACGDTRAPYEWLDRSGFAPVGLSEPVNVQLVVPKGISQLQIRTTRPAAVRLFRYLPGEQIYELPYREAVLSEEINWRYARIEKRVWWPMRPINHQELAKSEQLTTLVAQARLEPRWSGDESDPRTQRPVASVVVDPLGNPERHLIIEPLPAERAREARASWGGGMVAALPRGRDEGFRWTEDMHQRARIHYWLEPREVGAEVRVIIDGAAAGTFVARAAQGSWELLPLPPGEHQVRVETDAGSIELFLDRPPLSPGIALHRQRTVFAMQREPLRLRVTRRIRQRSVLHAVVYGPWKEGRPDVEVRVLVSGGRPNRIEGQPVTTITKADRRQPLPPAMVEQQAIFTDRQSGKAGYPRLISTVLGDDIAAGTHLVDIYSVYGQQLWVRFFITNYQIDPEEGALQWRFRDVP